MWGGGGGEGGGGGKAEWMVERCVYETCAKVLGVCTKYHLFLCTYVQ